MDATVNVEAREDAYSRPLDSIDVSVPELYQDDVYQPYSPLTAELGGPARATLLDERAHRGTGSSNPLPSSGESANYRFPEHEDGFLINSTFELGIAVEIFGLPGMGPDWYRVIGCARSSTDPLRTTLRRREPLTTSRRPRRCP